MHTPSACTCLDSIFFPSINGLVPSSLFDRTVEGGSIVLLLSLRLLYGLLYKIYVGVPSLSVPRSSLLIVVINGALLDTL